MRTAVQSKLATIVVALGILISLPALVGHAAN